MSRARLGAALDGLSAVLFPPRCLACDAGLNAQPRDGLCPVCRELLEPNSGSRCARCDAPAAGLCARCAHDPPPFARLRAPWVYGGALAELVAAAKFRRREDAAAGLCTLFTADPEVRALAEQATALVPVPLGRRRARSRGYNLAALLARHLGREVGRPVRHALRRARETAAQSDLPLAARADNVAGAFLGAAGVSGTVLLLDDVVTSTETVRQASDALCRAGAQQVLVAAVARTVIEG